MAEENPTMKANDGMLRVGFSELDNIKSYVGSVEDGLRVLESLRVGLADGLRSVGVGEPYLQELIGMNWVITQLFELADGADNGLDHLMERGRGNG